MGTHHYICNLPFLRFINPNFLAFGQKFDQKVFGSLAVEPNFLAFGQKFDQKVLAPLAGERLGGVANFSASGKV